MWRSLMESINQSCACVHSSFQPREGYANLTKCSANQKKRCSKIIKLIEGDRTCDHALSQSDLRFNITPPQGQNKSFSSQFCSFVNSHSVDQLYSGMSSSPINASALLGNTATTENLPNFVENFVSAPGSEQTTTSAPQSNSNHPTTSAPNSNTPVPNFVEMAPDNPSRSRLLLRYNRLQVANTRGRRNRQGPPRTPLQSLADLLEKCRRRRLVIRAHQQQRHLVVCAVKPKPLCFSG